MKVTEYKADENGNVTIAFEPEHPAESALLRLLASRTGTFESGVTEPKDGAILTVQIKGSGTRGY